MSSLSLSRAGGRPSNWEEDHQKEVLPSSSATKSYVSSLLSALGLGIEVCWKDAFSPDNTELDKSGADGILMGVTHKGQPVEVWVDCKNRKEDRTQDVFAEILHLRPDHGNYWTKEQFSRVGDQALRLFAVALTVPGVNVQTALASTEKTLRETLKAPCRVSPGWLWNGEADVVLTLYPNFVSVYHKKDLQEVLKKNLFKWIQDGSLLFLRASTTEFRNGDVAGTQNAALPIEKIREKMSYLLFPRARGRVLSQEPPLQEPPLPKRRLSSIGVDSCKKRHRDYNVDNLVLKTRQASQQTCEHSVR